jgi:hypothetical protein
MTETIADATNLHRKPLAAIRCRDAARVEIGRDGTARCAVSLEAALDVRAHRLSRGAPLRPIDPGLLWIAKLDAACLGRGKRLAHGLGDPMSLVLGSGGGMWGA